MNKEKVQGAVDDAAGRTKRQFGEWTDNPNLQVEGAARQVKGKAEKVVGNVKDAAKQASDQMRRDQERNEKQAREQQNERQKLEREKTPVGHQS